MPQTVSRIGWIVLVIAAVLLAPSAAIAGKRSGNVHFFVGAKSLDSNDWGDLDDPSAFRVEMSWGNTDWTISIAFGTGIIEFDGIVGIFGGCIDVDDSGSGVGAWLNAGGFQ
jgi:hypothetical protein